MSLSRYISKEFKKIDKKRTGSLLGFLVILAFFPIIFSSSGETQDTRTNAAFSANQAASSPTRPIPSQPQGQPGQQLIPASPSGLLAQPSSSSAARPPVDPIITEAYSPQPSIWLFLIPVAITFFTILFY